MEKIKIFLASSFELKPERDGLEREIYRKCKAWYDKGIFLHLDIWEDLSARMSATGSQSEYNKFVKDADLFVLLGYTKMGMYTSEEFEKAFGQFLATQKPFIFTYFKETGQEEDSLVSFKNKLLEMGHFISTFKDVNDLWLQFNKELERLETVQFTSNEHPVTATNTITGNDNIAVSGNTGSTITVNTGSTTNQNAEKIFNIENIGSANF
jgi:hypothetical protein